MQRNRLATQRKLLSKSQSSLSCENTRGEASHRQHAQSNPANCQTANGESTKRDKAKARAAKRNNAQRCSTHRDAADSDSAARKQNSARFVANRDPTDRGLVRLPVDFPAAAMNQRKAKELRLCPIFPD